MITKICESKLFVARNNNKTKKATALPVFKGNYPKDDYIADYKQQKRNALNTSFAVVASALAFTAIYILFSGSRLNKV